MVREVGAGGGTEAVGAVDASARALRCTPVRPAAPGFAGDFGVEGVAEPGPTRGARSPSSDRLDREPPAAAGAVRRFSARSSFTADVSVGVRATDSPAGEAALGLVVPAEGGAFPVRSVSSVGAGDAIGAVVSGMPLSTDSATRCTSSSGADSVAVSTTLVSGERTSDWLPTNGRLGGIAPGGCAPRTRVPPVSGGMSAALGASRVSRSMTSSSPIIGGAVAGMGAAVSGRAAPPRRRITGASVEFSARDASRTAESSSSLSGANDERVLMLGALTER